MLNDKIYKNKYMLKSEIYNVWNICLINNKTFLYNMNRWKYSKCNGWTIIFRRNWCFIFCTKVKKYSIIINIKIFINLH